MPPLSPFKLCVKVRQRQGTSCWISPCCCCWGSRKAEEGFYWGDGRAGLGSEQGYRDRRGRAGVVSKDRAAGLALCMVGRVGDKYRAMLGEGW